MPMPEGTHCFNGGFAEFGVCNERDDRCDEIEALNLEDKIKCTEDCSDNYLVCSNGQVTEMPMAEGTKCYQDGIVHMAEGHCVVQEEVISYFELMDACMNYPDLEHCASSADASAPPYNGVQLEDGAWYFKDKVWFSYVSTYNKEPQWSEEYGWYSGKGWDVFLNIRFGHDLEQGRSRSIVASMDYGTTKIYKWNQYDLVDGDGSDSHYNCQFSIPEEPVTKFLSHLIRNPAIIFGLGDGTFDIPDDDEVHEYTSQVTIDAAELGDDYEGEGKVEVLVASNLEDDAEDEEKQDVEPVITPTFLFRNVLVYDKDFIGGTYDGGTEDDEEEDLDGEEYYDESELDGSSSNGCCSLNYKECIDFCGPTKDDCLSCNHIHDGVAWLENGAAEEQCTARSEGCEEGPNSCCLGLECREDPNNWLMCQPIFPTAMMEIRRLFDGYFNITVNETTCHKSFEQVYDIRTDIIVPIHNRGKLTAGTGETTDADISEQTIVNGTDAMSDQLKLDVEEPEDPISRRLRELTTKKGQEKFIISQETIDDCQNDEVLVYHCCSEDIHYLTCTPTNDEKNCPTKTVSSSRCIDPQFKKDIIVEPRFLKGNTPLQLHTADHLEGLHYELDNLLTETSINEILEKNKRRLEWDEKDKYEWVAQEEEDFVSEENFLPQTRGKISKWVDTPIHNSSEVNAGDLYDNYGDLFLGRGGGLPNVREILADLEELDDTLSTFLKFTTDLEGDMLSIFELMQNIDEAEKDLKSIDQTLYTLDRVLRLVSIIKYVKPICIPIRNAVGKTRNYGIRRALTMVKKIRGSVTKKCKPKVMKALTNNEEVRGIIAKTKFLNQNLIINPFHTTRNCIPSDNAAALLRDVVESANLDVGGALDDIVEFRQSIRDLVDELRRVVDLTDDMVDAIDKISEKANPIKRAMDPFYTALTTRITVPIVGPFCKKNIHINVPYPCGVKKCKKCRRIFRRKRCIRYPCGVKKCNYRKKMTVPTFCKKTFSFTVNQVLNGISGVMDYIFYPINKATDELLKAIPLPKIPLLPDFPVNFDFLNKMTKISGLLEGPKFPSDLLDFPIGGIPLPGIDDIVCGKSAGDLLEALQLAKAGEITPEYVREFYDGCGGWQDLNPFCVSTEELLCGDGACPKETTSPTAKPTEKPSFRPTNSPTAKPTEKPSFRPTNTPTAKPTEKPSFRQTNRPTAKPTDRPSESPTGKPSIRPTESPKANPNERLPASSIETYATFGETEAPKSSINTYATFGETEAPKSSINTYATFGETEAPKSSINTYATYGETEAPYEKGVPCREDVELIHTNGTAIFENLEQAVQIMAQKTESVKLKLRNTWENDENNIDAIFYSYKETSFHEVCYEETYVENDEVYADEITIQCLSTHKFAQLKICVANTGSPLGANDKAVIPKCCHQSGVPENAHVVCYSLVVWCDSRCVTETDRRSLQRSIDDVLLQ